MHLHRRPAAVPGTGCACRVGEKLIELAAVVRVRLIRLPALREEGGKLLADRSRNLLSQRHRLRDQLIKPCESRARVNFLTHGVMHCNEHSAARTAASYETADAASLRPIF